jgi:hypothetical protein
MRDSGELEQPKHYFFIVARTRPDILTRARERLAANTRIEVIADRRVGERRAESGPCAIDRRVNGRRRATERALDDRTHPTLFVPKHVPTYHELQAQVAALAQHVQEACAEKDRLQREILNLTVCLQALTAADAIRKTSGALAAMVDRLATRGPLPA